MSAPESAPLNKFRANEDGQTLVGTAFKALRADILASKLMPGTNLLFTKLKTDYNVGLSPLREALVRLSACGLVKSEAQRGYFVANASIEDFNDISMFRQNIDGLALRKSIELGDDAWEAQIVGERHCLLLLERGNSTEEVNEELWELRHRQYHEALISGCNSPRMLYVSGMLSDQFDRYRRMSSKSSLSAQLNILQHQEITDAALDRKADFAVRLLNDHIKHATDHITTLLTL